MSGWDGTTLDTNSFANTTTGRFTIPAGVSKVKLSTNVRAVANGTTGNQWMIAKNGSLLDPTAGGLNIDIDASGYNNPGAFGQTAIIEVVEGDYFTLAYYVANTTLDVDAWYQIEVIEGSLLGHYFASTNVTNADNITVQANNSADETVYPIFVDGATGSQGPESDTGFTYNPSSGNLTATQLTGTLQTASQTNITALGTIATGTWQGTAVADSYVASATTWNAKIANVVEDTTPQLGGNLDINGKYITGTGGANITGVVTATSVDVDGTLKVGTAVTANAGIITTNTIHLRGGNFGPIDGGTDDETDAALVLDEGQGIYVLESTGGWLNVLLEKQADVITLGQQNTNKIDEIKLIPGKSGTTQLMAGDGTSTPVGILTTNQSGITVLGILTATSMVVGGLTYPTSNGSDGQVLTSDGAGVVQWEDASGGGGSGPDPVIMGMIF